MKSDFWHQRWQQKEIGFHNENTNAYLMTHWKSLVTPSDSHVFVPLCGKSQDMLWLAKWGHKVLGVELSEIAVREFFEDAEIVPNITKQNGLILYESPNTSIYCGDLFLLRASHLAKIQAVYDRGALVALPETMRQAYAAHLINHLPQAIRGLLVTFEYNQTTMQGPPFSVPENEIRKLFVGFDEIKKLEVDEIEFRQETVQMHIWKYIRR